jgi:tripartite-type tricarboxylate transporter receptor subunit TctC
MIWENAMKLPRRKFLHFAAAASALPAVSCFAWAQDYPSRPVRFVVPLAPGGGVDATIRIIAGRLSEIWGPQAIVENKPGGGGNLAAESVARSARDGYSILVASFSHAVNRFIYPSLNYDPIADFAPLSLIGLYPNVMLVPNSSPAHSVKEFIAYANSRKLSYASSGYGTSLHLAGELFKRRAGIEMTHVPYRGGAPAFNDLVPGRVDVMFNLVAGGLPMVRNGQLRGLAVTSTERVPAAPELPTFAEAGMPGFDVSSWVGLFAPARTPAAVVDKIHRDLVTALSDPAIKRKLEDVGVAVVGSTPAKFSAFLEAEMDKWGPVVKDANIKPE